jgi:hypothetical protein
MPPKLDLALTMPSSMISWLQPVIPRIKTSNRMAIVEEKEQERKELNG